MPTFAPILFKPYTEMKKLLFPIFAALATLSAAFSAEAQTPFVLNRVGAVAEYAMSGSDGVIASYGRTTVTAIDTFDDRNYTVSCFVEALDTDRVPMMEPTPMKIVVRDGTVNMAPNALGMEFEGTVQSYPADMYVGQEFEYAFTLKMMGVSAATTGSEKVTTREPLTTPAGTFDCFRVEGDIHVSVAEMGHDSRMKVTSWLSAGVGNVRIETRDEYGNLQMTQELVSLELGETGRDSDSRNPANRHTHDALK